ncbi:MAG: glycerophosphodiester phosphodiesterase [Bacteroidia bacterium]
MFSCSDDITPVEYSQTKLIAHRGAGSNYSGFSDLEENTLLACLRGLSTTDGIEIDIQRSNDHEIFLFHDINVPPCDEFDIVSIAASTKPKIEEYFDCAAPETGISTLKEVLINHEVDFHNKDIFLDVKAIFNLSTTLKMPTPQHYLNLMSQDIFDHISNYSDQNTLHIETENAVMLNAFKKHYPDVNTWLVSFGDIEKAIQRASKESYTGISIKDGDYITESMVQKAHNQGLKLCVWVVNERNRFLELEAMEVDFIQSDDIYLN